MTELLQYLPLLIPILLIEWGLAIAALIWCKGRSPCGRRFPPCCSLPLSARSCCWEAF
jgi:hypothetical protein